MGREERKKQARFPFSYDSWQVACGSLKYYRAGVRFIQETCWLSGQQRVWGHLWFSVLTQCLMFHQAGCLLAPCLMYTERSNEKSLCFYSGESGALFKLVWILSQVCGVPLRNYELTKFQTNAAMRWIVEGKDRFISRVQFLQLNPPATCNQGD